MIRLIFWIALVAIAIWAWRRFKSPKPPVPRASGTTLSMVRCAHCGVHLPSERALANGSQWYCSRAHLEQGPAQLDR
ncbi:MULTISPECIES: PP0621 family protein [Pseudomonas]|uniref:MYND finger n=1 Tax=Pseudomonas quercus TaxID=2722792 RepID=A0ABX0YDK9_9PSED|nr:MULTISPECIES: PP0621 family protein [Pseudomonas]MBF7142950.1 hypothetical protein [Pseudomonas sp. LY10J]NJP01498.1 hypothetical protein [Pseudomonas quercus]